MRKYNKKKYEKKLNTIDRKIARTYEQRLIVLQLSAADKFRHKLGVRKKRKYHAFARATQLCRNLEYVEYLGDLFYTIYTDDYLIQTRKQEELREG